VIVAKRSRPQGVPAKRPKPQGAMPNMQQMMAQVQQMQQDMEAAQEQLRHETVSASSGGGMVTVQVTGDLRVTSVTIDPEAVDPEDVEMLADMITAAVNEALRAAQELAAGKLGPATEGLDLGGLGGLGLPGLQP
jgi:DNA-binding YbaB/EbfC family protein